MKLFIVSLFMVTSVMAEEVPRFLKDAEIVVNLTNGNAAKFSANEWKVVPRIDKSKAKQLVISREDKKNRVRGLVGYGPTGKLNSSSTPNSVKIESNYGTVGGLGYDRKISDRFSLGAEVQSNGTFLFGIGADF